MVQASDFVVVAVKPHLVAQVLEPVRDMLAAPGKAVISVAAGCGFEFYEEVLGPGTHHLSTIPNTPIAVGAGVGEGDGVGFGVGVGSGVGVGATLPMPKVSVFHTMSPSPVAPYGIAPT